MALNRQQKLENGIIVKYWRLSDIIINSNQDIYLTLNNLLRDNEYENYETNKLKFNIELKMVPYVNQDIRYLEKSGKKSNLSIKDAIMIINFKDVNLLDSKSKGTFHEFLYEKICNEIEFFKNSETI